MKEPEDSCPPVGEKGVIVHCGLFCVIPSVGVLP